MTSPQQLDMSITAAPLTPDGRVAADVPCRSCGYNLRNAPFAGRCPECGADVMASATPDYLRYSHPVWVGKLKWGARVQIVALLLGVPWTFSEHWWPGAPDSLGARLIELVLSVSTAVAVWLLATAPPTPTLRRMPIWRWAARGGTLLPVAVALQFLILSPAAALAFEPWIQIADSIGVLLSVVVGDFATWTVVAHRVVQVPRPALARHIRWLRNVRVGLWMIALPILFLGWDNAIEPYGTAVGITLSTWGMIVLFQAARRFANSELEARAYARAKDTRRAVPVAQ